MGRDRNPARAVVVKARSSRPKGRPTPSPRRRARWRNRVIKGFIWGFLVLFIVSVLGIAVVTTTAHR